MDVGRPDHTQKIMSQGAQLVGRLYRPVGEPRAAVVLHAATGVAQGYYASFATWLAETQQLACLTYDYRDFGASLNAPLRQSRASMVDWGIADQQAARDHMRALYPEIPFWVIGHSLGGFMLPFQRRTNQIDRLILVASGPVHSSDHPMPYRLVALFFWHVLGPIAVFLAGFLPGDRIGFGAKLPSAVFWQWRRWCTTRGFYDQDIGTVLPEPDENKMAAELRLIALTDDVMVPPAAVWRLEPLYPEAKVTRILLDPKEKKLRRVGHIGAFASRNKALWPMIIS